MSPESNTDSTPEASTPVVTDADRQRTAQIEAEAIAAMSDQPRPYAGEAMGHGPDAPLEPGAITGIPDHLKTDTDASPEQAQ